MDFCEQGYWAVLPYAIVRQWKGLRISPLGVVPQRDRRPRLTVDYSFSGVNEDTVPLAPKEAMQFGRALQRIMSKIVHADQRFGPVYMAKIDIADGFYRVWLVTTYGYPQVRRGTAYIARTASAGGFPLALPMGWVESPPYFTTFTETACDLANMELHARNSTRACSTVHRLEAVAATPPADTVEAQVKGEATRVTRLGHRQGCPPVAAVDVYVDDFLLLAQTANKRQRVMRTTLHAIDDVTVAHLNRRGFERRGIGADMWLGQAKRAQ